MTQQGDKSCKFGSWTLPIGDPARLVVDGADSDVVIEVVGSVKNWNMPEILIGWEIGYIDRAGFFGNSNRLVIYSLTEVSSIIFPKITQTVSFTHNGKLYAI